MKPFGELIDELAIALGGDKPLAELLGEPDRTVRSWRKKDGLKLSSETVQQVLALYEANVGPVADAAPLLAKDRHALQVENHRLQARLRMAEEQAQSLKRTLGRILRSVEAEIQRAQQLPERKNDGRETPPPV